MDIADEHLTKIDPQAIEARAYELWISRGCPIGSPAVDWLRAEAELVEAIRVTLQLRESAEMPAVSQPRATRAKQPHRETARPALKTKAASRSAIGAD